MPTAGTHITVMQRVALSGDKLKKVLGDPHAKPDSPEGQLARFANLGAVGPDLLYALGDYRWQQLPLQTIENFIVKVCGSLSLITAQMEQATQYVDGVANLLTLDILGQIRAEINLLKGILNNEIAAVIINKGGVNLWSQFEPPREQDWPHASWFWADYMHYIRSGDFARTLIDEAWAGGNDKLKAYALGYLTHYVTDVIGHPYVNQIVGGTWRTQWQRHHLVENFIDTYVWHRWHQSQPEPPNPSTEERPLDRVLFDYQTPDPAYPAQATYARLHDLINVGSFTMGGWVDEIILQAAKALHAGLPFAGIQTSDVVAAVDGSSDKNLQELVALLKRTIEQVYPNPDHPTLLTTWDPASNGYPRLEDIKGAYGFLRILLRSQTEEKIQAPEPPSVPQNGISNEANQLISDFEKAAQVVANVVPSPGSLPSWEDVLSAIASLFLYSIKVGLDAALAGLAVLEQGLKDALAAAGLKDTDALDLLKDPVGYGVRYGLYELNCYLYNAYRSTRDVLVVNGYALPYAEDLHTFPYPDLWQSAGNPGAGKMAAYPYEIRKSERDVTQNSYAPAKPPWEYHDAEATIEQPQLGTIAPYALGDLPDAFISDRPVRDDMFDNTAFAPQIQLPVVQGNDILHTTVTGFDSSQRDFGAAIPNCIRAIEAILNGQPLPLPNYNLDGDRGYAWPTWDVDRDPNASSPGHFLDPFNKLALGGEHPNPAIVNALRIP